MQIALIVDMGSCCPVGKHIGKIVQVLVNATTTTRGRLKRTRMDANKKDVIVLHLTEKMALIKLWKKKIHIAKSQILG